MNVGVETDLGTSFAQEDARFPEENRAVAPAARLLQAPPAQPAKWPGRRGWVKLPCVQRSGADLFGRAGGVNQVETVPGLLLASNT